MFSPQWCGAPLSPLVTRNGGIFLGRFLESCLKFMKPELGIKSHWGLGVRGILLVNFWPFSSIIGKLLSKNGIQSWEPWGPFSKAKNYIFEIACGERVLLMGVPEQCGKKHTLFFKLHAWEMPLSYMVYGAMEQYDFHRQHQWHHILKSHILDV